MRADLEAVRVQYRAQLVIRDILQQKIKDYCAKLGIPPPVVELDGSGNVKITANPNDPPSSTPHHGSGSFPPTSPTGSSLATSPFPSSSSISTSSLPPSFVDMPVLISRLDNLLTTQDTSGSNSPATREGITTGAYTSDSGSPYPVTDSTFSPGRTKERDRGGNLGNTNDDINRDSYPDLLQSQSGDTTPHMHSSNRLSIQRTVLPLRIETNMEHSGPLSPGTSRMPSGGIGSTHHGESTLSSPPMSTTASFSAKHSLGVAAVAASAISRLKSPRGTGASSRPTSATAHQSHPSTPQPTSGLTSPLSPSPMNSPLPNSSSPDGTGSSSTGTGYMGPVREPPSTRTKSGRTTRFFRDDAGKR